MELKPGSRWKSAVCTAEVVVVRPIPGDVALECGGHPMIAASETAAAGLTLSADHSNGVATGKRYVDVDTNLELLGAKAGQGSLSVGGKPLTLKEAKALPASD